MLPESVILLLFLSFMQTNQKELGVFEKTSKNVAAEWDAPVEAVDLKAGGLQMS